MSINQLPVVHSVGMSFGDIERLAVSVAKSGLFGIKTPEQALALMMVSQAEGRHPALAARDYHIIQGTPAKKAEAMQRDFMMAGGRIEWHALEDAHASATFSHPQGGTVRIDWDMERAQKAQINNPMWKKYPRQMLRSRVISEGVRTVFPAATSGMYVPEEVQDFARDPIDVTPQRSTPPHDPVTGEIHEEIFVHGPTTADLEHRFEQVAASGDIQKLAEDWKALTADQRVALGAGRGTSGPKMARWKNICGSVSTKQPSADFEQPEPRADTPQTPPPEVPHADSFGLPLDNDEAWCEHKLKEALAITSLDEIEAFQRRWGPDGEWSKRVDRIPRELWDNFAAQVSQHHLALSQRS